MEIVKEIFRSYDIRGIYEKELTNDLAYLIGRAFATISKGKIIVATVKGDIHDIGKNIVKVILESYGFKVIDLGKNVPAEEVLRVAREQEITLVGLSALMTTTVKSMEKTIMLIRESGLNIKVMVGGAVLTEEYAKSIGADFYAKDAMESVKISENHFLAK